MPMYHVVVEECMVLKLLVCQQPPIAITDLSMSFGTDSIPPIGVIY